MNRRLIVTLCVVALGSPVGVASARGAQGAGTSDETSQDDTTTSSGTPAGGSSSGGTSAGSASPADTDVRTVPSLSPNITETRRFAPQLPRKSGEGRRVVYSNSLQWVWVVDKNETVIREMPVSGRRGVPLPGEYAVTTKSPWSFSLDFAGVTFRWMTRFALGPDGGNIGFHEIPRKDGKAMQTYNQLGWFAGSGCVRMATEDVKFIYRWATPGTKVVVLR